MLRLSLRVGRTGVALMLLGLCVARQSYSQPPPLGDVAREQKKIRKQRDRDSEVAKTLTNDDLDSGSASKVAAGHTPATSMQLQDLRSGAGENGHYIQPLKPEIQEKTSDRSRASSVLDRPKDSRRDVIIVPVGTELKVDIDQHKTIVPVRVGFATPIPALSQVTVEITRSFVGLPYLYAGSPYTDVPFYIEYATVTAVTVAGKTYPVLTDSLPLSSAGTNSEVRFTLGGPVKILR
jgi:hypothetical protein